MLTKYKQTQKLGRNVMFWYKMAPENDKKAYRFLPWVILVPIQFSIFNQFIICLPLKFFFHLPASYLCPAKYTCILIVQCAATG